MIWTRHVVHMGEKRSVYRVWSENLKERPLGRTNRKWEYKTKMDLKGIGWDVVGWFVLV
jgi:hypothetical protein